MPVFDEVVMSLARMNDVIDLDVEAGTYMTVQSIQGTSFRVHACCIGVVVCQSGCILESLDNMLAEHALMMPLDLGAKGRSVSPIPPCAVLELLAL